MRLLVVLPGGPRVPVPVRRGPPARDAAPAIGLQRLSSDRFRYLFMHIYSVPFHLMSLLAHA